MPLTIVKEYAERSVTVCGIVKQFFELHSLSLSCKRMERLGILDFLKS